jgi:hypothetical protein
MSYVIILLIGAAATATSVMSVLSVLHAERDQIGDRNAAEKNKAIASSSATHLANWVFRDVETLTAENVRRMKINPGSKLLDAEQWIDLIELEKSLGFNPVLIKPLPSLNKMLPRTEDERLPLRNLADQQTEAVRGVRQVAVLS